MKPDVLPILVGLSLCGASAAMLFYWYKTRNDDREDSNSTYVTDSDNKTIKLTIPNDRVPLIVGRNGANVKIIEEKTNTTVGFREKDENTHFCDITGKETDIKQAVALIKQELVREPTVTEEIIVPKHLAYGAGGTLQLQRLCKKAMATIHLATGNEMRTGDNEVQAILSGTRTEVNLAKRLIEEKIKIDAEERKLFNETELKREPRGVHKSVTSSSNSLASEISANIESEKCDILNGDSQPTTSPTPMANDVGKINHPLSNKNRLEVYVSAIASPSRFWLQLIGPQSTQLDNLVETMTNYYNDENNKRLHKINDPYVGQIVATMFNYDNKWYRAEIVGISPNEYNPTEVVLDLYFVDYGDSVYVTPEDVLELRTDFLTLRVQAIECFLANVKPAISDIWSAESISRFEELTHVAQWKRLVARVVTSSSIPSVQLYDSTNELEMSVADHLVAEGLAVIDDNKQYEESVRTMLQNNMENSKKLQLNNGGHCLSLNESNGKPSDDKLLDNMQPKSDPNNDSLLLTNDIKVINTSLLSRNF